MTTGTRRTLASLLVMFFVGTASSTIGQKPKPAPAKSRQEDAIREALLRYEMDSLSLISSQERPSTCFISIDGADPIPSFLVRLRDAPCLVKKASEEGKRGPGWTIFDKQTNQPAVELDAGAIDWKGKESAEIFGGYHCGELCGAVEVFKATFHRGRWTIKEGKTVLVS